MFKNMVVFQGCSFTWGQNLHHYEWIKKEDIIFPKKFFHWPLNTKDEGSGGEDRPRIFDWMFHEKFRDEKSQQTWLKLRASSVLLSKLDEEWVCVKGPSNLPIEYQPIEKKIKSNDFDYNKKISLFANKYIETIINYCK